MTSCYPMHLVPPGAAPYWNSNEIHHRVQLRPIKHDVVWQHTTKHISTGAPGAQTGCKTCTRCLSFNSEWLTQWQHLYKRTAEVYSTEHKLAVYGAARPQMMRWGIKFEGLSPAHCDAIYHYRYYTWLLRVNKTAASTCYCDDRKS